MPCSVADLLLGWTALPFARGLLSVHWPPFVMPLSLLPVAYLADQRRPDRRNETKNVRGFLSALCPCSRGALVPFVVLRPNGARSAPAACTADRRRLLLTICPPNGTQIAVPGGSPGQLLRVTLNTAKP